MEVIIQPTEEAAVKLTARIMADQLRARPDMVFGLATGATMEAVYAELDKAAGEFALPPTLLEAETEDALQRMARETVRSDADADAFKKDLDARRAEAGKEAAQKLRRSLIFRKIAKLENITVSPKEVDQEIEAMSRYYRKKPAELRAVMEKNGAIEELRNEIRNNKVWNFVADAAKVATK